MFPIATSMLSVLSRLFAPARRLVTSRAILFLPLLVLLGLGTACSQKQQGDPTEKRMFHSTGKFTKGYKEGMRDAEKSWTDAHAGWMWLWMMEREYREGYDEGWSVGRQKTKLRNKGEEQDSAE
ncbi:MAG: hypothetical protein ABII12_12670 [Planctomycetota bacterium]